MIGNWLGREIGPWNLADEGPDIWFKFAITWAMVHHLKTLEYYPERNMVIGRLPR